MSQKDELKRFIHEVNLNNFRFQGTQAIRFEHFLMGGFIDVPLPQKESVDEEDSKKNEGVGVVFGPSVDPKHAEEGKELPKPKVYKTHTINNNINRGPVPEVPPLMDGRPPWLKDFSTRTI
jgi:hypothetical protein